MPDGSMTPAVSVVVPVYCHSEEMRRYLEETLESVAKQTFRDFELILIDDRSPVDISPTVDKLSQALPSVRVIKNERNLGHVGSRNCGIGLSRAPLIAFLDHDDLWAPDKLEKQVRTFAENCDAAMAFCDIEVVGKKDLLHIDQSGIPIRPSFAYLSTHIRTVITTTAVMVKKEAMNEIGGFDSRYTSCDDYDAWLKILINHPIVHIPEKLAYYRLHEANVNYSVDSRNDNKLLTALIISYWKKAPLKSKLQLLPAVMRKLAGRVYFTVRSRK